MENKELTMKRQGNAAAKRVLACTEGKVRSYLDDLAEELISTGIFKNAKKLESGVWSGEKDITRIFNHDEMPQFIDYGVSSSASRGLVYLYHVPMNMGLLNAGARNDKYNKIRVAKKNFLL